MPEEPGISRKLIIPAGAAARFVILKDGDVPLYVERGAADLGVCGLDQVLESGADLVVDSSKDTMHASVMCTTEAISLTMAHLVRDPRGCAYSWSNAKPDPGRVTIRRGAHQSGAGALANGAPKRATRQRP